MHAVTKSSPIHQAMTVAVVDWGHSTTVLPASLVPTLQSYKRGRSRGPGLEHSSDSVTMTTFTTEAGSLKLVLELESATKASC